MECITVQQRWDHWSHIIHRKATQPASLSVVADRGAWSWMGLESGLIPALTGILKRWRRMLTESKVRRSFLRWGEKEIEKEGADEEIDCETREWVGSGTRSKGRRHLTGLRRNRGEKGVKGVNEWGRSCTGWYECGLGGLPPIVMKPFGRLSSGTHTMKRRCQWLIPLHTL